MTGKEHAGPTKYMTGTSIQPPPARMCGAGIAMPGNMECPGGQNAVAGSELPVGLIGWDKRLVGAIVVGGAANSRGWACAPVDCLHPFFSEANNLAVSSSVSIIFY